MLFRSSEGELWIGSWEEGLHWQVTLHLCSHGFVPGYKVWYLHEESHLERAEEVEVDDGEDVDRMDKMLKDMQPELAPDHHDSPTPEV